jgi:HEPN domain-containing protein
MGGTMNDEHSSLEQLLQELESRRFADDVEAAAAMVQMAIETNLEIDRTLERGNGTTRGPEWERLLELIKKVLKFLKDIAKKYGAVSYSIGVSLTGLDMSVEWSGPPENGVP